MLEKLQLNERWIRELIQQRKESMREFAYRTGFTPERLSNLLTGLKHHYGVTEAAAARIAKGLEIQIEDLVDEKGAMDNGGSEDE